MKKKIKLPKVTEEDLRTKRVFVYKYNKPKYNGSSFNPIPRYKVKPKHPVKEVEYKPRICMKDIITIGD
jgi:hypothetical protein